LIKVKETTAQKLIDQSSLPENVGMTQAIEQLNFT
jgi:hypothetical protein